MNVSVKAYLSIRAPIPTSARSINRPADISKNLAHFSADFFFVFVYNIAAYDVQTHHPTDLHEKTRKRGFKSNSGSLLKDKMVAFIVTKVDFLPSSAWTRSLFNGP